MSKFCTNCGKELNENQYVCLECGVKAVNNENVKDNNTNTIAIVGFILSFFIPIVGLILSIIGLKKSSVLNSGKGLSIAGCVISSIRILISFFIIFIVIGSFISYSF